MKTINGYETKRILRKPSCDRENGFGFEADTIVACDTVKYELNRRRKNQYSRAQRAFTPFSP